jgi:hypothetical protein
MTVIAADKICVSHHGESHRVPVGMAAPERDLDIMVWRYLNSIKYYGSANDPDELVVISFNDIVSGSDDE